MKWGHHGRRTYLCVVCGDLSANAIGPGATCRTRSPNLNVSAALATAHRRCASPHLPVPVRSARWRSASPRQVTEPEALAPQAAFAPTSAGLRSQRHSGCQGQPDVGVSLWPCLRTWHVHLSLGLSRLSLSNSKRPSKSGSISGFKGLPVGQVQVLMRVLPPAADPPQRGAH